LWKERKTMKRSAVILLSVIIPALLFVSAGKSYAGTG
jgi:hypothetical protein